MRWTTGYEDLYPDSRRGLDRCRNDGRSTGTPQVRSADFGNPKRRMALEAERFWQISEMGDNGWVHPTRRVVMSWINRWRQDLEPIASQRMLVRVGKKYVEMTPEQACRFEELTRSRLNNRLADDSFTLSKIRRALRTV